MRKAPPCPATGNPRRSWRNRLLLVVALSACGRDRSENDHRTRSPSTSAAAQAARPVRVASAPASSPAATTSVECAPYVPRSTGPSLRLANRMPGGDTGTTHTPVRATIADVARHRQLVLENHGIPEERWDDTTEIAPILERVVPLSTTRALVLGWSSTGSGMQAEDALLVVDDGLGLRVADRLHVATRRGATALLLCGAPGGGLRLGVPVARGGSPGDGSEALIVNGRTLGPADVVPAPAPHPPPPLAYAPPFGGYRLDQVAWFEVVDDRLVTPRPAAGAGRE